MKKITINELESLSIGAAILGSGGGGDPFYNKLMAKYQIEKHGPINIISVDDLSTDDIIVPIGIMGAPLVTIEKLPSGKEFLSMFSEIEKYFGKKPKAIMPAEIGGSNGFVPLIVAGILGLPILDADLMGRAFPELQMISANLKGVSQCPAFITDALGKCQIIEASDSSMLEKQARNIAVSMGSSAAVSIYFMNGKQIKDSTICGSISRALEIGDLILNARSNKLDPIKTLVEKTKGIIIGSGIITNIDQSIKDGFLKGSVTISNDLDEIILYYQNENLIAYLNDQIVTTTPDIIIPLDSENGTAITSESLAYGLRVSVVALPSPKIWTTPQGLNLVGPRYFGYDIDYKPINGI